MLSLMYGMLPTLNLTAFSSRGKILHCLLFIDGMPVFKRVYCSIHNLPPAICSKSKNIILSGLWVGPAKPPMQYLLRNYNHKSKVRGIFDLPAKAIVLSTKQYNGKFGCSLCLHPGKSLSNRRVYPAVPPRRC